MTDTGRERRFEQLAHDVWQPLQGYLRRRVHRDDVDDLLEEVLVVLWRRLDELPGDAELPYAYRVAANCLANHRRAEDRRLRLLQRLRDEPPASVPEADMRVAAALVLLRPQEQEVLRLWAWEGLEPRDLAVVLECSPNAAANRLSRARAALREQLGHDQGRGGHKHDREDTVQRP